MPPLTALSVASIIFCCRANLHLPKVCFFFDTSTSLAALHHQTNQTTIGTSVFCSAGADVSHGPSGTSIPPLNVAARNGHVACLTLLLDWGAEVRLESENGTSALMEAASRGHAACVAELMKAGADPDVENYRGTTAVMMAAAEGHADVVRCLLQHNASVERQSFQVGLIPCLLVQAGGCLAHVARHHSIGILRCFTAFFLSCIRFQGGALQHWLSKRLVVSIDVRCT